MSPSLPEQEVLDAIASIKRQTGEWPTPHLIAGRAALPIEAVRETLIALLASGELVCRGRLWMPRGRR